MARCEWVMTASIGPGQEIGLEKGVKQKQLGNKKHDEPALGKMLQDTTKYTYTEIMNKVEREKKRKCNFVPSLIISLRLLVSCRLPFGHAERTFVWRRMDIISSVSPSPTVVRPAMQISAENPLSPCIWIRIVLISHSVKRSIHQSCR